MEGCQSRLACPFFKTHRESNEPNCRAMLIIYCQGTLWRFCHHARTRTEEYLPPHSVRLPNGKILQLPQQNCQSG
jgi:hypothetical protein